MDYGDNSKDESHRKVGKINQLNMPQELETQSEEIIETFPITIVKHLIYIMRASGMEISETEAGNMIIKIGLLLSKNQEKV